MEPSDRFTFLLRPDEQVLWTGQPCQRPFILRWTDALAIPFSLLWSAWLSSWIGALLWIGAPLRFLVMVLPAMAIGAYLLFGRFLHNWFLRRRTQYLVTNQRALVVTGGRSTRVSEQPLARLFQLESSLRPDGSGTIWFDRGERPGSLGLHGFGALRMLYDTGLAGMQFFRIPDADHVLEVIGRGANGRAGHQVAGPHDTPGWVRPRSDRLDRSSPFEPTR